jgi:hypothetical protein
MDRDEPWELYQPHRSDQEPTFSDADRWIGEQMKAVVVPVGLRARIDQSLREVRRADERRRRRRWMSFAAGGVAAASLMAAVFWAPLWGDLTVDSATPECVRLFQQLADVSPDAEDWGADSAWPVGFYTNYFRGRDAVDVLGHSCSAYVFSKDRCRALAVMIPRRAFAWRSRPSEYIVSSTGGVAVVVFPSGDYVCVVVVDGDAGNLVFFRDDKVFT